MMKIATTVKIRVQIVIIVVTAIAKGGAGVVTKIVRAKGSV